MSDQNTNPTPAEGVELTDLATDPQELTETDEKNIVGGRAVIDADKKAASASAIKAPAHAPAAAPAKVAEPSSVKKI